MDPQPHEHYIHIEQLQEEHVQYDAYGSSEVLLEESEHDRLNRFSNTSTLVGGSPTSAYSHRHHRTLSQTSDVKKNGVPSKEAKGKRLWHRFLHSESGRLACSFFFFTFVCIGMAFCNQLSDHRWVDTPYTQILLRDRGFDVIAAQADITPANNFVMTSVVFTVLGIGLICPTWTMRAVVLRRILWVIGTLSVFRALTLSVTTLPTPKEECRPSLKTGFWDMFIVALQMIPGTVEACTDDIFSGHTVFMVSCAIQWRLYCKNKWITYLSYLYISIGLYFVVATRLHYTVDVVLAVFITFAGWSIYISQVDVVMEEEYFGIKSHHEKYRAFDETLNEYEFAQEDDTEQCAGRTQFRLRRRQLEHAMNRLRGPRIGYGRGEYDRVAFIPVQFNLWLTGLIRWCDGLDLRMRPAVTDRVKTETTASASQESSSSTRWEELVVRYRCERGSGVVTSESWSRRKVEGDYEEECVEEMIECRQRSDYNASTGETGQQRHQGRWRSMPSPASSSRQCCTGSKDEKTGDMDRSRKLHILKIVLLILVNALLVVKIIQVYRDNPSAPKPHWPQEMDAYPGGAILNDGLEPTAASAFVPHDAQQQQQQQQQQQEQTHRQQKREQGFERIGLSSTGRDYNESQAGARRRNLEKRWSPEGAI
ncbi:hypothetical protein BGZ75_008148 [Mortierella antarctica]|nr:hypothetical protein BGZ75_008148 [Mortierella antarctica]